MVKALSLSSRAVPCLLAARAHKQRNALPRSEKQRTAAKGEKDKKKAKHEEEKEEEEEREDLSVSLSLARSLAFSLSLSRVETFNAGIQKVFNAGKEVLVVCQFLLYQRFFVFEILFLFLGPFFLPARARFPHAAAPLACLSLDLPLLDDESDAGRGGLR